MKALRLSRLVRLMDGMIRILCLALALGLGGSAAEAQELAYLIERIEVRDLTHVSPEIVIDESRIVAGRSYSETELRSAIDRIRRLPFILDAEPSLEKGSQRDTYVLVITVDETRPFFYLAEVVPALEGEAEIVRDSVDNRAAAGVRMFVGAQSMIHLGALTREDDRPDAGSQQVAQAGYTRFGLLGGRGFATLTLNRSIPGGGELMPGLVAGMYLGGNRTLTLTWDEVDTEYIRRRRERVVQIRLSHNTTDDPFFPDRGTLMAIAPLWLERRAEYYQTGERGAVRTEAWGVESEFARYWPLSEDWTLGAELEGGYLDATVAIPDEELDRKDLLYGTMRVRLSRLIQSDASSESRAEITLSSVSDRDETFRLRSGYDQLSFSWARRDAWGSVRVGAGYAW